MCRSFASTPILTCFLSYIRSFLTRTYAPGTCTPRSPCQTSRSTPPTYVRPMPCSFLSSEHRTRTFYTLDRCTYSLCASTLHICAIPAHSGLFFWAVPFSTVTYSHLHRNSSFRLHILASSQYTRSAASLIHSNSTDG